MKKKELYLRMELISPGMDYQHTILHMYNCMYIDRNHVSYKILFNVKKSIMYTFTCVKDGKMQNESRHSVLTLLLELSLYSQEVNSAVREFVHGQTSVVYFDTLYNVRI